MLNWKTPDQKPDRLNGYATSKVIVCKIKNSNCECPFSFSVYNYGTGLWHDRTNPNIMGFSDALIEKWVYISELDGKL